MAEAIGNYKHDNASPFAPVHSRDCDPKGPTRRRWLEQSRSRESSSGVRDRFTMEEPLGVHRRAKRNLLFSHANGPRNWTTGSSRNCGRSRGIASPYGSLTSGTTTRVTGIGPMAMRTGNSMTTASWRLGSRPSTTFPSRNQFANITGRLVVARKTTQD
jgi:hypothetical protein